MILVDTGPLVALIDPDDSHRAECVDAARSLGNEVMLTTWPCFTEAMYFLGKAGGYLYQADLWDLRRTGQLEIHLTTNQEADRIETLMRQYQDTPMDLADASLIAVAESRALRRIFTFDRGFFFYRLLDGSTLSVVR